MKSKPISTDTKLLLRNDSVAFVIYKIRTTRQLDTRISQYFINQFDLAELLVENDFILYTKHIFFSIPFSHFFFTKLMRIGLCFVSAQRFVERNSYIKYIALVNHTHEFAHHCSVSL